MYVHAPPDTNFDLNYFHTGCAYWSVTKKSNKMMRRGTNAFKARKPGVSQRF